MSTISNKKITVNISAFLKSLSPKEANRIRKLSPEMQEQLALSDAIRRSPEGQKAFAEWAEEAYG